MGTEAPADGDWAAWSRESVARIQAVGDSFQERHGLHAGTAFQWDLDAASITFETSGGRRSFRLVCVGTVAPDGTFLWGWANETHPESSRLAMQQVREFGETHDLGLLVEPMWEGQHAAALEMLAISGRILQPDGFWVEPETGIYLLLFGPAR